MDKEEIFARRLDKSKKKRERVTKEAVSEHKEKKLAEKTELPINSPKNPEDPENKE